MPTITALTPHGRRDSRYDVAVDSAVLATVGAESIARLELKVGRQLDEGAVARLLEEGAIVAAVDRGLGLLGFRDRSAAELRRRLVQKGVEAPSAAAAVERLVAAGLVDDGRYARSLAFSKAVNGGASRRRVAQELARRGVARDVAEQAIEVVWAEEEVDQRSAVLSLARKRAGALSGLDPVVRRRRLYGFLVRRGYEPDEIRAAVDAVERDEGRGGS